MCDTAIDSNAQVCVFWGSGTIKRPWRRDVLFACCSILQWSGCARRVITSCSVPPPPPSPRCPDALESVRFGYDMWRLVVFRALCLFTLSKQTYKQLEKSKWVKVRSMLILTGAKNLGTPAFGSFLNIMRRADDRGSKFFFFFLLSDGGAPCRLYLWKAVFGEK